jgi:hypothetical protein
MNRKKIGGIRDRHDRLRCCCEHVTHVNLQREFQTRVAAGRSSLARGKRAVARATLQARAAPQ